MRDYSMPIETRIPPARKSDNANPPTRVGKDYKHTDATDTYERQRQLYSLRLTLTRLAQQARILGLTDAASTLLAVRDRVNPSE